MTTAGSQLQAEMRQALLAEFGACAIYADLARGSRDAELSRVLARFHEEELDLIVRLRGVLTRLGVRPRSSSPRRRVLAGLLAAGGALVGRRLVLRMCAQAADEAARSLAAFQLCLLEDGDHESASVCGGLSETRRRHAQTLETWVQNS